MSAPGVHCRNRKLEWWPSGIMVALAIWTVIWPGAFAQGRFAAIDNVISPPALTALLAFIGIARILALYCNGRCPLYGPLVRVVGAVLSGSVFTQMALALWVNHLVVGNDPSPGIVVYAGLTLQEVRSAIRAATDAKSRNPGPR